MLKIVIRIMIFLVLSIAVLACGSESGPAEIESSATMSTAVGCLVKDEWLNKEYDHAIDYENPDVETDFFLLVYSNSPDFCDYMEHNGRLDEVPFQCKSPNKFGWVIHGLWGESNAAYLKGETKKHPRFCEGDLDPLSLDIIIPYLCMSPGTSLLQGEWEKHGACDFSSASQYFNKTKELFERYKIPPKQLKARAAMQWMKENNSELKDKWLYLSKHEFGICFSTEFEPISCPRN